MDTKQLKQTIIAQTKAMTDEQLDDLLSRPLPTDKEGRMRAQAAIAERNERSRKK